MKSYLNKDDYILVDIENYENVSNELLSNLDKEKEIAKQKSADNSNYVHMVNINDIVFQIRPSGSPRLLIYFL